MVRFLLKTEIQCMFKMQSFIMFNLIVNFLNVFLTVHHNIDLFHLPTLIHSSFIH